jgi:hypothetical protein
MKIHQVIFAASLILSGGRIFAQTGAQVPLSNLKTTNNPCFQLLDIAPSSITEPASAKDLGLAVLQNLSGGSALPKNFAFSVAPYWYFRPSNENVYKYLNLREDSASNMFAGILRKLDISLSSTFNDSTSGSLLKNTNYYAVGCYTNILTYRTPKSQDSIRVYLNEISSELKAANTAAQKQVFDSLNAAGKDPNAIFTDTALMRIQGNDRDNILAKDKTYATASKGLVDAISGTKMPLFQLDGAGAYSQAFPGNSTSGSRFNRLAGWLTATFNIPLSTKHADYLSILVLGKLMGDNLLTDTAKNVYTRASAHDIGGKLTYTMSSAFSLGFEFIQRTYGSSESGYNSHRAVGFLQYKVNDNIYLTGSFGQNFGNSNNLFTLLGVNFGFGNKSASLPD